MINKLKQQCGETLIEALVSLLIAVLSMGVLSSAVLASSNLNAKKKEKDNEYSQKLEAAESMSDSEVTEGRLHLEFETLNVGEGHTLTVEVNLYGGEENDFASYQEKTVEDAP